MTVDKFADIDSTDDLNNEPAVVEANKPAAAAPKPKSEFVVVTVTKFGHGKVSTGEHVAGEGDIYADRGDKITVSPAVAEQLEARGLAEAD